MGGGGDKMLGSCSRGVWGGGGGRFPATPVLKAEIQ